MTDDEALLAAHRGALAACHEEIARLRDVADVLRGDVRARDVLIREEDAEVRRLREGVERVRAAWVEAEAWGFDDMDGLRRAILDLGGGK